MALKKGLDPSLKNFTILLRTLREAELPISKRCKVINHCLKGKTKEEGELMAAELLEKIKNEGIEAIIAEMEQKPDDTWK